MAEDTNKPWEENKTQDAGALGLRTDGPTLEEYVKAGYAANSYPPEGYAPKASVGATMTKEEFVASGKSEEDFNLYVAAQEHLKQSVLPQLQAAIDAKLREQAEANRTKTADEQAQEAANEKVVTGAEVNGISHMDLLRASFKVDARLAAVQSGEVEAPEPISPTFHQPTPEGHEAPKRDIKWEPGK